MSGIGVASRNWTTSCHLVSESVLSVSITFSIRLVDGNDHTESLLEPGSAHYKRKVRENTGITLIILLIGGFWWSWGDSSKSITDSS